MSTHSKEKIYLTIALFGTHQVALNGNPVIHFEAESARALLAYLVMEVGRVHQRETLAALLWPDHATSDALANLRQALNRLRHAVGDREAVPPFLNITRKTIQFNPAGDYWLDVATFDALTTAVNRHPHPDLTACSECLQRLQEAANIYRGELLDQFVMESALFEEWLHRRRDHYHRRAITTLDQLATGYETCGEYERAQAIVERQIELEPWRENAYRRLMRMLALRGQRGAALLQYQRCCQMLNDELDVEPAAETTALYHQIRAGGLVANGGTVTSLPISAVSLVKGAQLVSRKHNLPGSLSPIIGREQELQDVGDILRHPDCRLLTIVGLGGVGKTRLALAAAHNHRDSFYDGVYVVSLAEIDPSPSAGAEVAENHIITAVLTTLQRAFFDSAVIVEDSKTTLFNLLQDREILLLLDNFEHLIASASLLTELRQQAPNLTLLVTSRERLRLDGEWCFEVSGLPVPEGGTGERIQASGAVQLFLQTAQRVQPGFQLLPSNWTLVAHICRFLSGHPLGLILAAAWVRALSCEQILSSLMTGPELLEASQRDTPSRHRSLQMVFDQTWATLTTAEQQLFQQLAVFPGDFSLEAALAISTAVTPRHLAALVDKCLLYKGLNHRYRMHPLLKQYSREQLVRAGQYEMYCDRHCAYFLVFLHRLEPLLPGREKEQAFQQIEIEIDNVRRAWEWAIGHGQMDRIGQGLESLIQYYRKTGRFAEGEAAFAQAVRRLLEQNEREARASKIFWQLQTRLGGICSDSDHYEEARALLQESLTHWESSNNRQEEALCLYNLANLTLFQHEFDQGTNNYAVDLLQKALTFSREAGVSHLESGVLVSLGIAYTSAHDNAAAKSYYLQALEVFRHLGDKSSESRIFNNLGALADFQCRFTEARSYYERALHNARLAGNQTIECVASLNVGYIYHQVGDYTPVEAYYARSLEISRKIGHRRLECMGLIRLGMLHRDMGKYIVALQLGQQALRLSRELGVHYIQALASELLGRAQESLGNLPEAENAYRQAFIQRHNLRKVDQTLDSQADLARIALHQNDLALALELVEAILITLAVEDPDNLVRLDLRTFLTCYHVLLAVQNPRTDEVLIRAYSWLQGRAARIGDAALQRSFLENVPAHREILTEWEVAMAHQ